MAWNTTPAGRSESAGLVERVVVALRRSFFLSFATFGAFLLALGYTFELLWMVGYPVEDGIIAGMLAIWGATALFIGGIGYGVLRYLRNY
ncbi:MULTISPECIES: hypothetical protein [unclassified Haladaptatus]|uniref:hypothetical protein n=1 Tax=unclassified Haladaptatus TaxID=2622732 RepID=UPI0023E787C1|nr:MULTISPECIES: hypothetical protein [unclassified Haladaptatus]